MKLKWILLGTVLSSHCPAATTIDICKPVGSFPPFYTTTNTGLIDLSILRSFSQGNYQVVLHSVPWPRCLDGVQRGTYDGASSAVAITSRLQYMQFPMREGQVDPNKAVVDFDLAAVAVRNSGIVWAEGSFSGGKQYRALVLAGWDIVADLLRERGLQMDDSPKTVDQQLSMLVRGRAELAVGEQRVLQGRIAALGLEQQLELLPASLMHMRAYTAFNRNFYRDHSQAIEQAWQQQEAHRLLGE